MALVQQPGATPWSYAPEPIEGNSLTRAIRSGQNAFGVRSEDLYNWAIPGIPVAQGVMGAGQSVMERGLNTLDQPLNYWSTILSGNRPAMTAALSPEIQRINAGYTQARNQASQFAPSGGGRAALMSSIPFQAARDTSNLFSTLRPQAANAVQGIGMGQASIGQGISQVGMNLLQGLLNQLALSNQAGQIGLGSQLNMRGQDIQEGGQWKQLLGDLTRSAAMGYGGR